ncbi:hypothetical protein GJ496_011170 [Pomphorhynchus laevis]|nr:hypothetical protein GJ496_011170 [Pomphorhynchus laevis]
MRAKSQQHNEHQWSVQWKMFKETTYHSFQQLQKLRRFCAVCGSTQSNRLIQCTRCAMIYYCSTEHRNADFQIHSTVCEDLVKCRVGLQAFCLYAVPSSPNDNDHWKLNPQNVQSWDTWFRMKPHLRKTAERTSTVLEALFKENHTKDQLTDAFLHVLTEYMSYPLSIGKALIELNKYKSTQVHPNKDIKIYLLYSPHISQRLGKNINETAARFGEVANMLPRNTTISLVIVGEDVPGDLCKHNYSCGNFTVYGIRQPIQTLLIACLKHRDIKPPDLLAAFDSIESDWGAILPLSNASGIPVYVSFTNFADIKKFVCIHFNDGRINGHNLIENKYIQKINFMNSFASMLGQQDPASPNLIYYTNSFQQLILPKNSKSFTNQPIASDILPSNSSENRRRSVSLPRLVNLPLLLLQRNKYNRKDSATKDSTTIDADGDIIETPRRRSLKSIKASRQEKQQKKSLKNEALSERMQECRSGRTLSFESTKQRISTVTVKDIECEINKEVDHRGKHDGCFSSL